MANQERGDGTATSGPVQPYRGLAGLAPRTGVALPQSLGCRRATVLNHSEWMPIQ